MPLVIICGPPQSGKSKLAKELKEFFIQSKPELDVQITGEDYLLINK